MGNNVPSRKSEIKKKDDENAKKDEYQRLLDAKVALSNTIIRRQKTIRTLTNVATQCQVQQQVLANVTKDLDALGCDAERIHKVIEVLQKVETVLYRESAKI